MNRTFSGAWLVLLFTPLLAARADVIYSAGVYTGGNYDVITQVYGGIDLEGGATLNAQASGGILGYSQQRASAVELNNGQVNVLGATIAGGTYAGSWAYGIEQNSGTLNVYSGSILGGQGTWADAISMSGGTLNLYGGTVKGGSGALTGSGITVNDGSTVNIYGGSIEAGSVHAPGSADGLTINAGIHPSTVNIYGSGFNYPLGPLVPNGGTLTGTLADGTPLNLTFSQYSGAIVLVPEPEPVLLLGCAAALSCLRRRMKANHRQGLLPR
jgi:hypothetical protein